MKFKYHKDGTLPLHGEIFVFGSNLAGRHGAGSAKVAREKFGAQAGCGQGPSEHSYAIPTKDEQIESRTLFDIQTSVLRFSHYTRKNPDLKFFATAIGCGLAGHKNEDIAPMFQFCNADNCSFPDAWMPYLEFAAGLENIENIIFENESSFATEYCYGNELISVSFNSETVKIYYILSNGQHITNSFSMRDFNTWLRSIL